MDVEPRIHLSTHKHDLILFQELCVNNDRFFQEEDEEILCDCCIHPITASYYSVNGFGYGCETCNFSLHVTCAALPDVIMHETHDHPLFQMEAQGERQCYTCAKYVPDGSLIFKCKSCDVLISYYCAMHSRSIRHRWDRQHPILLRYPPHGKHPDHFMCDMCEELINPKYWLYSCFKCDVGFHTECAPRYQKYRNMKFGGEVQISCHPHTLKYLRKPTLKITCDKCEAQLDEFNVFECETCYDCFYYLCVTLELP
ncbi:hypothetical protein LIER_13909 [Lithospermum erythrorhizon]|uniref:DC1 domain-containing protein n=1 Tax=Lithospermum erythrorhizon TaxID=34254 RepID=A0AAV3PYN5_LITER